MKLFKVTSRVAKPWVGTIPPSDFYTPLQNIIDVALFEHGLQEIANQILLLNEFSPTHAKNAFAGCLLIPGLEPLRFPPLGKGEKRLQ